MASCDLTIQLDQAQEVFHPGDEVSGRVQVRTDGDLRCDGLTVELCWQTHGRGSTAKGEPQVAELFQGEWQGPTNTSYAFRFQLPAGPMTYHGHYLNVGWFLRARADVPWKLDPKAEAEVVLQPGEADHQRADWQLQFTEGYRPDLADLVADVQRGDFNEDVRAAVPGAAPGDSPQELRKKILAGSPSKAVSCGCIGLLLAFLIPIAGLMGYAAWDGVQRAAAGDWAGSVVGLVFGGILIVGVLGAIVAVVRARMIGGRFGKIEFQVEPDGAPPGESVAVRVSFTPKKEALLNRATLVLRGYERVVSGSGTSKSTRTHEVHEQTFELSGERRLPARHPVLLETRITLPHDAPPSFQAPRNELTWKVRAHLDVARFPDWGGTRTVVVHPIRRA